MALKLKFRTLFPASVTAASPLTLVKTGSRYALGFDVDALKESIGIDGKANLDGGNLFTGRQRLGGDPIVPLANWDGDTTNAYIVQGAGTLASPNLNGGGTAIFQKISGFTGGGASLNATLIGAITKTVNDPNARVTAIVAEAQDNIGWTGTGANNFIEAFRGVAVLVEGSALGSAYGAINAAGGGVGVTYTYLVGNESSSGNNSGTDAPVASSFNRDHFAAAYVASSDGDNKSDAGFITNGYNRSPFQTGFLIAAGSVSDSAFVNAASVVNGLDLTLGSYSGFAIKSTGFTITGSPGGGHATFSAASGYESLKVLSGSQSIETFATGSQQGLLVSGANSISFLLQGGSKSVVFDQNANISGGGGLTVAGAIKPGSFTVATLPAGTAGQAVYCSNCRVFNGAGTQEGAAAGTGGLVTYNGAAWKIAGTNSTAAA